MSSIASFSSLIAAAMRVEADRAAAELVDDRPQQPAIDLVEAVLVHLEQLQRRVRDVERDRAVGAHLRVVAHAAQQPVGDARRAARAPGDLDRRGVVDRHAEDPRRSADDLLEVGRRVEVEPVDDAEARRSGDVSSPARVVAPTSVNGSSGTFTDRALGPWPITMSSS